MDAPLSGPYSNDPYFDYRTTGSSLTLEIVQDDVQCSFFALVLFETAPGPPNTTSTATTTMSTTPTTNTTKTSSTTNSTSTLKTSPTSSSSMTTSMTNLTNTTTPSPKSSQGPVTRKMPERNSTTVTPSTDNESTTEATQNQLTERNHLNWSLMKVDLFAGLVPGEGCLQRKEDKNLELISSENTRA
ncbi:hypothetical protein CSKR_100762 [Clonorchis sinensis]|uniref:Uncharacterized protein n=1 Tax=Clonorchis sinensis TaxID=79923 RepID=A0A8T1M733_CLOSI|nr:hypothetical protein CSKR_100762 [Clonorchis sinensis]